MDLIHNDQWIHIEEYVIDILWTFRDLSVNEFFEKFTKLYNSVIDPDMFGCESQKDLITKIATETGLIQIDISSSGDMRINLSKGARYTLNSQEQQLSELSDTFLQLDLDDKSDQSQPIPADAVSDLNFSLPRQELPNSAMNGEHFPIVVSQVFSPAKFFFNLHSQSDKLGNLMEEMDKFYNSFDGDIYKIRKKELEVGAVIAANYRGYGYHRASVLKVLPHGNLRVSYVDYGTVDVIHLKKCRFLKRQWLRLPAQALVAGLHGIIPKDNQKCYSASDRDCFFGLVDILPGTLFASVRSGLSLDKYQVTTVEAANDVNLYQYKGLTLSLIGISLGDDDEQVDIAVEMIKMGQVDQSPLISVTTEYGHDIVQHSPVVQTNPNTPGAIIDRPMKSKLDRLRDLVATEDDLFEPSDYLKLLRIQEMIFKKLMEKGDGIMTLEELIELKAKLVDITKAKDEQEEKEVNEYVEREIIPKLPPGVTIDEWLQMD